MLLSVVENQEFIYHGNIIAIFFVLNFMSCVIRGECEAQVKGYSGARYKKFSTKQDANEFINSTEDPHFNKIKLNLQDNEITGGIGNFFKSVNLIFIF